MNLPPLCHKIQANIIIIFFFQIFYGHKKIVEDLGTLLLNEVALILGLIKLHHFLLFKKFLNFLNTLQMNYKGINNHFSIFKPYNR